MRLTNILIHFLLVKSLNLNGTVGKSGKNRKSVASPMLIFILFRSQQFSYNFHIVIHFIYTQKIHKKLLKKTNVDGLDLQKYMIKNN